MLLSLEIEMLNLKDCEYQMAGRQSQDIKKVITPGKQFLKMLLVLEIEMLSIKDNKYTNVGKRPGGRRIKGYL